MREWERDREIELKRVEKKEVAEVVLVRWGQMVIDSLCDNLLLYVLQSEKLGT